MTKEQTVTVEAMIEYLQAFSDVYESAKEKYGSEDNTTLNILTNLSSCHMMVEKLTGKSVKFERNEEGKVIVTI